MKSNVEKIITEVSSLKTNISAEYSALIKEAKDIDLKLCDLYHLIEFSNFGAAAGYKVYKELHDLLQYRREVKDSVVIISKIMDTTTLPDIDLMELTSDLENRTYSPRIIPENEPDTTLAKVLSTKVKAVDTCITTDINNCRIKLSRDNAACEFENIEKAIQFVFNVTTLNKRYKDIEKKVIKIIDHDKPYGNFIWSHI